MLASLLFPYDDDAPKKIDGWLSEIEREGGIARYVVEGTHYIQVHKWLNHQKIDHPTPSKIPPIPDNFAKPRETSRNLAPDLDLGLDQGTEGKGVKKKPPQQAAAFVIPDWIDSEAWSGFVDMRKRERHPLTDRAAQLVFKTLNKLRLQGHDPTAVLDQSTQNGWRGIFPINGASNGNGRTSGKPSVVDRVETAIADRKRREASQAKIITRDT